MAIPMPTMSQRTVPTYQNAQAQTTPIFMWVNGSEEASRCPIPANGWAILMDRNEDVFYIARCDAYGRAYPIETYDFTRRADPVPEGQIGRAEFDSLSQSVATITEQLQTLMNELGAGKENS